MSKVNELPGSTWVSADGENDSTGAVGSMRGSANVFRVHHWLHT